MPPDAELRVLGVGGLPEIAASDDVAALIAEAIQLHDRDIVVVTSKVVSKAEGAVVDLVDVEPSPFASEFASRWGKDPRLVEIVLRQARRIVRMSGPLLITETHHGFVCANSGVDESSSGAAGRAVVLPDDPDASARHFRQRFAELGVDVAVIISDTFGRPWREGQTDIAVGLAGVRPLTDYIGQHDPHGHEFRVQQLCIADELASAAELVKGNLSRVPAAVVRGFPWVVDESASAAALIRPPERDLFR